MIKKLIEKIFGRFCRCKVEVKNICDHANAISKKVKYCVDCNIVIDAS
jgi:hypothetical protein